MEALDSLGINLGYMVVYIANILLMLALLSVAFRPITDLLEKRREREAEGVNQARKAQEALASAESDKQVIIDEARAEAQRILGEARSRAEEAAGQIRAQAQSDAQRIREQAESDAAAERQQTLADMREQIISLSIAAANHLIGESLDQKKQQQVVTDFFTNVPIEAKDLGERATVVTAIPLSDSEQKKFRDSLGSKEITFVVDPSILGGVVVRSGAQEVDNSFRYQLYAMRASLS